MTFHVKAPKGCIYMDTISLTMSASNNSVKPELEPIDHLSYSIQSETFESFDCDTVKVLLSTRETYLILDTPERGLIREGGLFKTLHEKDI